jgi:hypothetical protein
MSRTFTPFAEQDPVARSLVEELPQLKGDVPAYRKTMHALGVHLATSILPQLSAEPATHICVICTVEDADFLARGLIETLAQHNFGAQTRMLCMWNQRVKKEGLSISPVLRSYEEDFNKQDSIFIIVKSIVSGACVVKTNLTKAISTSHPKRILIASPVMLAGAQERLAREFPPSISSQFEFVHFATDTEKSADGEEVLPGIGGSVYELLGLGDGNSKNKYVPDIVRERRRKTFPELQPS